MSDIEKYYKGENEIMKKVPVKYSGSATDDPFTPEAYKTIEKLEAENKRLRKAVSNAREILRILYNDHNISDEDMHDIVTHELEKGSDE